MNEYIKMAWRNIWRNKRRTVITAASIFFAIYLALVMRAFQLGSYDQMIKNVVENYTGYIQVQAKGYWEDRTIDNTFDNSRFSLQELEQTENVKTCIPRLESFALASSGNQTKGVLVLGIAPEREDKLTKLKDKLVKYKLTPEVFSKLKKENTGSEILKNLEVLADNSYSNTSKLELDLKSALGTEEGKRLFPLVTKLSGYDGGQYLQSNEAGVLVADKLAKFLKLGPADTLVLIGQGYHGRSAAGKYPIRGIVKLPTPDLDNQLVFMELNTCQEFYSTGKRLTSIAMNLYDHGDDALAATVEKVKEKTGNHEFVVKDWEALNTVLVQQIESDNGSGKIMLGILYMIVGFGIFGTVLMMTSERKREFAVMVSIGMQKFKLAYMVTLEMIVLSLLGILSGILASIPTILHFVYNPIQLTGESAKSFEVYGMEPIMPMAFRSDFYINQTMVISILVIIAIVYPIFSITRINETKALRGR